jgi:hypothetical protein
MLIKASSSVALERCNMVGKNSGGLAGVPIFLFRNYFVRESPGWLESGFSKSE